MSSNPLLNTKRLKTIHTLAPADKSRTGERKRGGLIIHPLPTPVKDTSNHVTEDTLQALPARDTPVIERNRIMRREPIEGRPSIGRRGKRASSSFENKGLIPQPHSKLDPASFHKHIDFELPEAHRARHLLVWCASRAASNNNSGPSSSSSPSSSQPDPSSSSSLPPLTAEGVTLLQEVQKNVQKMLLEQKIEISFAGHSEENNRAKSLKPHEQNVKNLQRERDFTEYIQRCTEEGEAWSALVESYQARRTALVESLNRPDPETPQEWIPPDTSDPLYERESRGAQLAQRCLESASRKRDKSPVSLRIAEVENKVDRLHNAINVSNQLTMRVSRHLDKRFDALSTALAARAQPSTSSEQSSSLHLLSSSSGSTDSPDALLLLRALARTDMTNPGELGDTARRMAARDTRGPSERERRLTALTQPPVSTPRRPGTPRRKPDANG